MAETSPHSPQPYARSLEGISLNTGISQGTAVLHSTMALKEPHPQIFYDHDTTSEERTKLSQALHDLEVEIHALISHSFAANESSSPESRDILSVYLQLARDPSWQRQLNGSISEGHTAQEAVDITLSHIKEKLSQKSSQTLWHERIGDFEDLSTRLKKHLAGPSKPFTHPKQGKPFILVADRIGPADLLDYNRGNLAGLILIEQSQTSHVAIVARSLNIPVVGITKNLLNTIKDGDPLLLDGIEGVVYLHPEHELIERFKALSKPSQITEIPDIPHCSQTRDGVPISILLNAGLVEDVEHIQAAGAEGIGLYRTEISFMMTPKFLNVQAQTQLYREILQRTKNFPVVFRTLDVGGDKVLPYLERLQSENPKKRERVTKVFFDRSLLLQYQFRALIRACGNGPLIFMLPMVAEVDEVITARDVLTAELEREKAKGNPTPTIIKMGTMIEVPALVYQLPKLFPHVDFVSVGTNDLFQFFFGLDREYPKLTDRYDVLSPTFLKFLKSIQEQCETANVPLSVCGEMAGRPLEALALIGLGYHTLSMSAAASPLVKKMICSIPYKYISEYMTEVCTSPYTIHGSIRQDLLKHARGHGIEFDL